METKRKFLGASYPRPTTLNTWLGLEGLGKVGRGLRGSGGSKEEGGTWSKGSKRLKNMELRLYFYVEIGFSTRVLRGHLFAPRPADWQGTQVRVE